MRACSLTAASVAIITMALGCGKVLGLEEHVPYADFSPESGATPLDAGTQPDQATIAASEAGLTTSDASDAASGFAFPSCAQATTAMFCFDAFNPAQWLDAKGVCATTAATDTKSGSMLVVSIGAAGACDITRSSAPFDATKGFRFRARVSPRGVSAGGFATILDFTVAQNGASEPNSYVLIGAYETTVQLWFGGQAAGFDSYAPGTGEWRDVQLHVDPAGPDRVFVDGAQVGPDLDLTITSDMVATLRLLTEVKGGGASARFDDIVLVPF